jgi:hypothetical protein
VSRIAFELAFDHDYDVSEIDDYASPAAIAPVHDFKLTTWVRSEWFTILFSPANAPEWIGRFAIAYNIPPAFNGVYSTPNPNRVCVVGGGQGFVIDVRNPKDYQTVRRFPITGAAQSTTANRLVFADFTALEAWDANGKSWDSGRIALDELEIVRIDASSLFCRCRGLGDNYHFEFDVDLVNGTIIGGGRRMIASDDGDGSAAKVIDRYAIDVELQGLQEDSD